jgi:prepilin-type N-terminal cleavage/methylation domain-containing protein
MYKLLQKRLSEEKGFTLIELLVVIIILGILMAIAIPSYMSFRGRAQTSAAETTVTGAVTGMEAHLSDYGVYPQDLAELQRVDAGAKNLTIVRADADDYCIASAIPNQTTQYYIAGPGGSASPTPCT